MRLSAKKLVILIAAMGVCILFIVIFNRKQDEYKKTDFASADATNVNPGPKIELAPLAPISSRKDYGVSLDAREEVLDFDKVYAAMVLKNLMFAHDPVELAIAVDACRKSPDYIKVTYLRALLDTLIGPHRKQVVRYDSTPRDGRDYALVDARCALALEKILDVKLGDVNADTTDEELHIIYSQAFELVQKYVEKLKRRRHFATQMDVLKEVYGRGAKNGALVSNGRMKRFLDEWPPIDNDSDKLKEIVGEPISFKQLYSSEEAPAPRPGKYNYMIYEISGVNSVYYIFQVSEGKIISLYTY